MLASQILGIVGSQIKIKIYFSLAIILIKLEDVYCQKTQNKNKNCQQELGNLVEFIETNEHLEEELQKFEDEFEQDEI